MSMFFHFFLKEVVGSQPFLEMTSTSRMASGYATKPISAISYRFWSPQALPVASSVSRHYSVLEPEGSVMFMFLMICL
jgi:hypothetical protein